MTNKILLLIAAYIRRTNHTLETEVELIDNVIADLAKVNEALKIVDRKPIDE